MPDHKDAGADPAPSIVALLLLAGPAAVVLALALQRRGLDAAAAAALAGGGVHGYSFGRLTPPQRWARMWPDNQHLALIFLSPLIPIFMLTLGPPVFVWWFWMYLLTCGVTRWFLEREDSRRSDSARPPPL